MRLSHHALHVSFSSQCYVCLFFSSTVHAWSSSTCLPSFPISVPPRAFFSFLPRTSLACCTDTTASIATSSKQHVRRRVRAPLVWFTCDSSRRWDRARRPRTGISAPLVGGTRERGAETTEGWAKGQMETSTAQEVHHYSQVWMACAMAAHSIHGRGIKTARKLHEQPSAVGSCHGSLSKCTSSRTDSKRTRSSMQLHWQDTSQRGSSPRCQPA